MRKRLWEVANLATQLRVILLREKAQVISDFEQPFEQFLRILDPANHGVVVGQPKGASEEGSLRTGETIGAVRGVIAKHKAISEEMLLDCRYGAPHSRIAAWEESDARNHQHTRIESLAAVRLRKRSHSLVEAALADLGVDSLPKRD